MKHTCFLFFFLGCLSVFAQERNTTYYQVSLETGFSDQNTLPFWMTANRYGMLPSTDYLSLHTALGKPFSQEADGLQTAYKVAVSSFYANRKKVLIDELYLSLRYRDLQLDLGSKHPALFGEGLSSSNGNIVHSNHARSFPGYRISLTRYIALPFAKKWLSFKGYYGDFLLNDPRVVHHTRLHSKGLFLKSVISPRLQFTIGLNHYVQWAGTSPVAGRQPAGFSDYLRVISGSAGSDNALPGEQANVLGNQLGAYHLQFDFAGEYYDASFYHSHLFEDASGRELQNWKDGLYGLFLDFKEPGALLSHLLAEFTHTRHASGIGPGEFFDENGVWQASRHMDNYFNSWLYQSGWTYFGNSIGSPYFTTRPVDEDGITRGIILGDNRFIAVNLGAKGAVGGFFYTALLSYSEYTGWFYEEYDPRPTQFSGLISLLFRQPKGWPFDLVLGASFDRGTYRKEALGGFIKIVKKGYF